MRLNNLSSQSDFRECPSHQHQCVNAQLNTSQYASDRRIETVPDVSNSLGINIAAAGQPIDGPPHVHYLLGKDCLYLAN